MTHNELKMGVSMVRSTVYIVSDDVNVIQRTRAFCQSQGLEVQVYSPDEWKTKMDKEDGQLTPGAHQGFQNESNVIPFPSQKVSESQVTLSQGGGRVKTINELESIAIENAINEFNGNLTEAAKALGIGRATLYRKVKQYSIDPTMARKKRAA